MFILLQGTDWKFVKPEKGGDKDDFRSKRKSTNNIIANTVSAQTNPLRGFERGC